MNIKTNLAHAYQILAKLGMDDHTYTHLSARAEEKNCYYINPFGLRFSEITKDNLLKVTMDGKIIEGQEFQYNKTGYVIHGNIYKARPELNAIFHLHTIASVAVSAMKKGLMPISQWALHFYNQVNYHEYNSLVLDSSTQGSNLVDDLGDKNILLLRNHGMITCGKTIHEAMFYCYHLELACKTQVAALSSREELIIPNKEICEKSNHDLLSFEEDLGARDWQAWVLFVKK